MWFSALHMKATGAAEEPPPPPPNPIGGRPAGRTIAASRALKKTLRYFGLGDAGVES